MAHKGHSVVTIESIESDLVVPQYRDATCGEYVAGVARFLRPHFLVANHRLPRRLVAAMAPPLFFKEFRRIHTDLKGPVLIMITLACLVLYGLHSPDHSLAWELLTTAKLTVGYWVALAVMAYLLGYVCETNLTPQQVLSIAGYSLTGHCLVLLVAELLHQEDSHAVFFVLLTVFGGLASGRLVMVVLARTPGPGQRLVMCSVLATANLMHLIYLHFACMRKKFKI